MYASSLLHLAAVIVSCSCAVIGNGSLNNIDENISSREGAGTTFRLYVKTTADAPVIITEANVESTKGFDVSLQTKIIVHGWRDSADNILFIKEAYMQTSTVYNIVMVDWSAGAAKAYSEASRLVPTVAQSLARLILAMVDKGAKIAKIHIVGHSLGAHIAGIASQMAGKVARVTGMDPEQLNFASVQTSGRLDATDATFVDVIHTDAGKGWSKALGHADFYPNGGIALQPACQSPNSGTDECSHDISKTYFAESINSKLGFWGTPCSSWVDFQLNRCTSNAVLMGEKTPTSTTGTYYLKTSSSSPYALGKTGA